MKFFFTILFFLPFFVFSQSSQEHNNEISHDEESGGKFRIAVSINQTYISEENYHESEHHPAQLIPTDGIEIQYFISKHFSIKWSNEIEFMSYILKDENGLSKVRKNAFLSSAVLGYEVSNFGFFAGLGYEFEKNENLLVKRFGIEYILELNENIDISPAYILTPWENPMVHTHLPLQLDTILIID